MVSSGEELGLLGGCLGVIHGEREGTTQLNLCTKRFVALVHLRVWFIISFIYEGQELTGGDLYRKSMDVISKFFSFSFAGS